MRSAVKAYLTRFKALGSRPSAPSPSSNLTFIKHSKNVENTSVAAASSRPDLTPSAEKKKGDFFVCAMFCCESSRRAFPSGPAGRTEAPQLRGSLDCRDAKYGSFADVTPVVAVARSSGFFLSVTARRTRSDLVPGLEERLH